MMARRDDSERIFRQSVAKISDVHVTSDVGKFRTRLRMTSRIGLQ